MLSNSHLKQILIGVLLLAVQFLSISPGYAEWTSVDAPTVSSNWELLDIRFFWAAGQDFENQKGVLLHFSNGSWTSVDLPSVSPNWGLSAIDFASSHEGWAVGQDYSNGKGVILRYQNGAWTSVEPPVEISSDWGLSAVDPASSTGGWMAGQDFANKRGILLHYETVLVTPPTLSTTTISEITTTTATSGGTISSDGGAPVTARGVCWNTVLNPVVGSSNCTSDGTGTGTFTSSITGLTPGTAYHVRAYATNSAGTGYGNDLIFTTLVGSLLPVITTMAVSGVTSTTAISGGTITSAGVTPVTSWGVCWNTVLNPVVGGTCTNDSTGTSPGTLPFTFTSYIIGLTPGTAYHVRAYATNSAGTGYGDDITFLTLITPTGLTTLATADLSNGTASTAPVTRLVLTPANLPAVSSDWGLSSVRLVWAVGQDSQNKRGVLLHFVSGSWISVEPPEVSSDWELSGVDLISSKEAWAVGQDFENGRGVLLQFSNGSWKSVIPPEISSDWGLSAITFISFNEAWAVGQDFENKRGVLLHFMDGSWTSVESPGMSSDWGLSAVDLISSNEGWAIGKTSDGNGTGVLLQFTMPQISASPAAIDYHEVETGAFLDQTVVVRNAGNGDLVIGAITSPSSPFVIQTDGCSGITLPPLQTCKVTYRFLPDSQGTFYDSSNIPSNGGSVTVTLAGTGSSETVNYIHLANPLDGQTFTVCPDLGSSLFQWESSGVFAGIQLEFSLTPDFTDNPLRVKGNPGVNRVTLRSSTWKKILLLPGIDGGRVYWRVIGTKKDKTTVESDLFSFEVTGAEPVANLELSHTSKTAPSPPALSWENRCNTKFKAWFGNGANFQTGGGKKIRISFGVEDPNENQGIFTKVLTSSQWSSIRRLGGDVTGAVLYWYVESWDALGRKKNTDVMTFILTD